MTPDLILETVMVRSLPLASFADLASTKLLPFNCPMPIVSPPTVIVISPVVVWYPLNIATTFLNVIASGRVIVKVILDADFLMDPICTPPPSLSLNPLQYKFFLFCASIVHELLRLSVNVKGTERKWTPESPNEIFPICVSADIQPPPTNNRSKTKNKCKTLFIDICLLVIATDFTLVLNNYKIKQYSDKLIRYT